MEKLKSSYIADGNAKWCIYFEKQFNSFFKILSTELSYDPAILLLGIYTREIKTYIHIKTRT